MFTREDLEQKRDGLLKGIRQLESNLMATRGGLEVVEAMIAELQQQDVPAENPVKLAESGE